MPKLAGVRNWRQEAVYDAWPNDRADLWERGWVVITAWDDSYRGTLAFYERIGLARRLGEHVVIPRWIDAYRTFIHKICAELSSTTDTASREAAIDSVIEYLALNHADAMHAVWTAGGNAAACTFAIETYNAAHGLEAGSSGRGGR